MGIFVQDNFVGTAASLLTAHVGDNGCTWLPDFNESGGSRIGLSSLNTGSTVLDGAGHVPINTSPIDMISAVSAPQLDVTTHFTIVVGAAAGGPSIGNPANQVIRYAPHAPFTPYPAGYVRFYPDSNGGGAILLKWDTYSTSQTDPNYSGARIQAPGYCFGRIYPAGSTIWGGAQFAPMPTAIYTPGDIIVVKTEHDFTNNRVRVYINDVYTAEWVIDAVASGLAPPSAPGNFVIEASISNMTAGGSVSALQVNTLDPPTAFWTDYTGSILETV